MTTAGIFVVRAPDRIVVEDFEILRNALIGFAVQVHFEKVAPFRLVHEKSGVPCTENSQPVADVLNLLTELSKVDVAIPDGLPIILVQDGECL